jgi:N-ethylmaleimide reductase
VVSKRPFIGVSDVVSALAIPALRPCRGPATVEEHAMQHNLFLPARLGTLELRNRIVMAPMTRNRSLGNVPQAFAATYYGQRAGAGLIVTEGTAPSPNGLGYARIPGLFSTEQITGWRQVTEAVHQHGGRIFAQLMHTGRIGHPANLPTGAEVLGPMAEAASGDIWTDTSGLRPHPVPRAMTEFDLQQVIAEYVKAARNAREAGFDGVELHAANGYLLEQFLNPGINRRSDRWGGSRSNRARLLLETTQAVAKAIGADRVGVRLSPFGVFNDMPPYAGIEAAYAWLADKLSDLGIAYLHLVDHSSMGAPAVPDSTKAAIRKAFHGSLILSGGYDRARAEADLATGRADFIAFGRPFIANPELVEQLRTGATLAAPDQATFYTSGEAGYTDYPVLAV